MPYPHREIARAISLIESLNPKPGGGHALESDFSQQITPDFNIQLSEGYPIVTLNGRNVPELYLSNEYNELLKSFQLSKSPSKSQTEAVQFVRQRMDAARWFIDAVRQRRNTLLAVINAVVARQREFVLSGDWADLKPMGLKDIAEDVSMDISTVSRAVSGKFVSTPYGTIPLKDFFSTGMTTSEGEDITTRRIKEYLVEVIEGEDKKNPLTDQQLVEILDRKGFRVARRTVAKYREAMDIPVARLRRTL